MKGVFLLFYIFICNITVIFAQDIHFSELDFGEVPIGNDSIPNIKMLPFIITNNTQKKVLIEHMIVRDNYPYQVALDGNKIAFVPGHIVKYFNGPLEIKANSEIQMNTFYQSSFLDSISLSGNKLSTSIYIYYRFENESNFREDSVKFYARSVPGNGIDAFGFKYIFYGCETGSKFISNDYSVTVINNSEYDLKVDSMHISIDGNNLSKSNLIDNRGQISNNLPVNGLLRYKFNYNFIDFERSVGRVRFFASDINGQEKVFNSLDSTVIQYLLHDEDGKISISNRIITYYQGEKVNISLRILTCNDENYFIDSIYFYDELIPESYNILPPFNIFPFQVFSDSIYQVTVELNSNNTGVREKKLCVLFRNSNGETYERCLDLIITVITPSSIKETEKINTHFLIYPQPANDVLNIKSNSELTNKIDLIKLYDLYGNLIYQSSYIFGELSIPITNLNNGMYFLQIQSSGNIFNYKVPVGR
jgi:hypothetical protein